MGQPPEKHWAVYGATVIRRGKCPRCGRYALILEKRYLCCGISETETPPEGFVSMSATKARRKQPSNEEKEHILKLQNGLCFYCDEPLRRIHWDHFYPFSFSQQNNFFTAACPRCNVIKRAKLFDTGGEAREYVQRCIRAKLKERKEKRDLS